MYTHIYICERDSDRDRDRDREREGVFKIRQRTFPGEEGEWYVQDL